MAIDYSKPGKGVTRKTSNVINEYKYNERGKIIENPWDSDVEYLYDVTMKYRGLVDPTARGPLHVTVKPGDLYISTGEGEVIGDSDWRNLRAQDVKLGAFILMTDSDWVILSGGAVPKDSEEVDFVESLYEYVTQRNLPQNLFYTRENNNLFFEIDSDHFYLIENARNDQGPDLIEVTMPVAGSDLRLVFNEAGPEKWGDIYVQKADGTRVRVLSTSNEGQFVSGYIDDRIRFQLKDSDTSYVTVTVDTTIEKGDTFHWISEQKSHTIYKAITDTTWRRIPTWAIRLDSEELARRSMDSDLQVQITDNDSDIEYLYSNTAKLRGSLDITKDGPSHTEVKPGDMYIATKTGGAVPAWVGLEDKDINAGDVIIRSDSDFWLVIGQTKKDSEHITPTTLVYTYATQKNKDQYKLHFAKKSQTLFFEGDSDKFYVIDARPSGHGWPTLIEGVNQAGNVISFLTANFGPSTTDLWKIRHIKADGTVSRFVGASGVTMLSAIDSDGAGGGAAIRPTDSEDQRFSITFSEGSDVGDKVQLWTIDGRQSFLHCFDGKHYRRVNPWEIALDSEELAREDADSDLSNRISDIYNVYEKGSIRVKKPVHPFQGGDIQLNVDAAYNFISATTIADGFSGWVQHDNGFGVGNVWIIIDGILKYHEDTNWTATELFDEDGNKYIRGTNAHSNLVFVNGTQSGIASTIYNFDLIKFAEHDLETELVVDQTRPDFDSDIIRNTRVMTSMINQIDSEFHRYVESVVSPEGVVKYTNDSDIEVRGIFFNHDSDGYLKWNRDHGTLDLALSPLATVSLGQETTYYGRATEAISIGDVVMFAGAQGDNLLFRKSDVTVTGFKQDWIMGVAKHNFAANDWGYVSAFGHIHGIDTSTFTLGDIIYMDPDVPGGTTNIKPPKPKYVVTVAAATNIGPGGSGILFARVSYDGFLHQKEDVLIQDSEGQMHNQIIAWDSDQNLWRNVKLTADFGEY